MIRFSTKDLHHSHCYYHPCTGKQGKFHNFAVGPAETDQVGGIRVEKSGSNNGRKGWEIVPDFRAESLSKLQPKQRHEDAYFWTMHGDAIFICILCCRHMVGDKERYQETACPPFRCYACKPN